MTGSTLSVDASPAREAPPHDPKRISSALRRFAWFVLAYNVLDILWGVVVTATGSGDGCGDQWPLCQGAVVPQAPQFHTMVEFAHRVMSGVALLLIVALLVWAWRATRKGALARWAAGAAFILVMNEAFLGALLVTVAAHGASQRTSVFLFACHLTNTLLLLASLTLTVEFLARPLARSTTGLRWGKLVWPALGIVATLVVGVSGSLAALGDALYPARTLAGAFHQDFSAAAPLLLRLRWIHPVTAVIAGLFVAWLLVESFRPVAPHHQRSLAIAVLCALVAQFCLGVLDVLLRAPTWLQVLHLLGADVFWICLVLLTAAYCLVPRQPAKQAELASATTVA